MSVCLKLEASAGATIQDCIIESVSVSDRIGIKVQIDLNGIQVFIRPSDSAVDLYKNYLIAAARGVRFASAYFVPKKPSTAKVQ